MNSKFLYKILLILLILSLRLNAFACDTLCVVYNEKYRKFEIDTANGIRCNQKELGIYNEYFKKLTIPEQYPYCNVSGLVFLTIKGDEVKILRGIGEEFNKEIIKCYENNDFHFDGVFIRIRIPHLEYKLYVNKSYFSKEELYKKFSIAKTNKKISLAVPDSNWFCWNQKFIKMSNLKDLTQTKDSIYIRVRVGSICNKNSIYELKYNSHGWQAREISYWEGEFRCLHLGFILFNKNHQFTSKKKKNTVYMEQRKIIPVDSIGNSYTWDSIRTRLYNLDLMQIKTQEDVDSSTAIVDDGIWFYIEIATPEIYRYLSWANPDHASPSFDKNAIEELYKILQYKFNSEAYYEYNYKKYKMVKYKKNKWSE